MAKAAAKSKSRAKAKAKTPVTTKAKAKQGVKRATGASKRKPASAEEVMARFQGKVVPVIKVNDADHAVPLVTALLAGGIDIAEITFRTSCAGEAIRRASQVPGVFVGAGTVVDAKQVDVAVDMGANFVISPGFSDAVAARCRKRKVLYIPGVVTPTEIMHVTSKWKLQFLKFAPAGNFGGAGTIKSYGGFFPSIKWMPTGGVTEANIGDYLKMSNVIASGGTWFVTDDSVQKAVDSGDWTAMTEAAASAKAAADAATQVG